MKKSSVMLLLIAVLASAITSSTKDALNQKVGFVVYTNELALQRSLRREQGEHDGRNQRLDPRAHPQRSGLARHDRPVLRQGSLSGGGIMQQVRYILDTVIASLALNPHRKFTYACSAP